MSASMKTAVVVKWDCSKVREGEMGTAHLGIEH